MFFHSSSIPTLRDIRHFKNKTIALRSDKFWWLGKSVLRIFSEVLQNISRSSTKILSKWVHRQSFQKKNYSGSEKKKVKKEIIPSFLQDCFLLQTQSQRAQMGFSQDMQQREYSNILLYKLFHAVNFTWRSFINWKCLKAFAVWNAVEKKYTDVKVCKTATKESKWRGHISLLAAVCVHVNTFLCLSLWGPFMDKKFIST